MLSRRASLLVTALLLAGLTGCTGTPAATPSPTPTATGFASEEEAFAAAEETFAGYVEASNTVVLSDPSTFEAPYSWTAGDEYATQREQLTQMSALGWSMEGDMTFDHFSGTEFDAESGGVSATVCIDVSDVRLFDADGKSVVPEDRPSRQRHELAFVEDDTPTGLAVSRVNSVEDGQACDS